MAKKSFLIFLMLLFSLSKCDDFFHPLFENFLLNSTGEKLDERCMNTFNFDFALKKLNSSMYERDYAEVLMQLFNIFVEVNEYCKDINITKYSEAIYAELMRIQQGGLVYIMTHFMVVFPEYLNYTLKVYNNETDDPAVIGEYIGKTVSYFFLNSTNLRGSKRKLNFVDFNKQLIWDIFQGLIHGLTQEKNYLCKNQIINNKEKIESDLKEVLNMLKQKKSFIDIFSFIMTNSAHLAGIINDCRIQELINVIQFIKTDEGFHNIIHNLHDEQEKIFGLCIKALMDIISNNNFELGVSLGNIIKVLINFYVN